MGRPLGQHFLFQRSILERIAASALPAPPPLCIEIGPGPGALTELLLERTERLVAVELDPALADNLRRRYAGEPRFSLLEGNVLETELRGMGPAVVCGNIPYYITSPIIERALALGPELIRAVFLIQKEVADRLAAEPGSRDYGYLTVATQALCAVEKLFVVKPASFRPPPKVDSAVVRLTPHAEPLVADYAAFRRFASQCFRQKRKTLRNNLGRADIPYAGMRAEQLTLAQLAELFQALRAR
ncbi:MAG: ribosomal RNA small subunit methyltransferase A [Acidobacteria bacterium]|nr:ribosomal RNA small subunit methyltransferase A [Acidobacteriota bacterium]